MKVPIIPIIIVMIANDILNNVVANNKTISSIVVSTSLAPPCCKNF